MASKNPADYDYAVITLPAFPNWPLACAYERATNRLWFAVRAACAGIRVDYSGQLAKLQAPKSDLRQYVDKVPMPTVKGYRDTVCIDWEGLGMWIAGIQGTRSTPDVQEYLRLYKRQLFAAANAILLHKPAELAARLGVLPLPAAMGQLPAPQRGGTLQALVREHEDRLAKVEDLLARAGEDAAPDVQGPQVHGSLAAVNATCPHCGGPLRVETGPTRVVAADE